jgi:hypothetical protein
MFSSTGATTRLLSPPALQPKIAHLPKFFVWGAVFSHWPGLPYVVPSVIIAFRAGLVSGREALKHGPGGLLG